MGVSTTAGIDEVVDAHADLVYDQVRWRLGDGPLGGADRHADVVHDTFMIAAVAPPPPAERLRAWLLALARNECLRVLAAGPAAHTPCAAVSGRPEVAEAVATPVVEPPWPERHPGAGLPAEELRPLVQWAAEGLDRRDREMIELGLRHGLDATELAPVLGQDPGQTRDGLERLVRDFGSTLGAVVLARADLAQCTRLADLTYAWRGEHSPRWRARLTRHVGRCGPCRFTRKLHVDPVGILRMPATARLPHAVRRWVLADAADGTLARDRAALTERAGPWRDGFPVPLDARARLRRRPTG